MAKRLGRVSCGSVLSLYGAGFFRYAAQQNWCALGLAETIESPRMYSMAGLAEGPSREQVRRLMASPSSERPGHIRDRAIILLLALYGLRSGELVL